MDSLERDAERAIAGCGQVRDERRGGGGGGGGEGDPRMANEVLASEMRSCLPVVEYRTD